MRDEFGAWARGTTFLSPNYKLFKMPAVVAAGLTAVAPSVFVAGSLLTTVASYAIYTAGTAWALRKLAPKVPPPNSPDLSNRLQPDSPKQVIYGQTRVGGAITYIESTDNSSNLQQVICIAGHPVEEIGDIYLNDGRIAASNIGNGSSSGGSVNDANWKNGGNQFVKVFKGNGSNNTTALSNLYAYTNNSEVNSTDFTGNGLSFLYTNFEYHKKVFTNGIPTVNAVVKGRKVYDPRKDSTSVAYDSSLGVSTHRKTNDATWQYSNNPSLCILDYLTQEHGLNADFDEIDDQEWADEADICDETVTLADSSTQTQYELNGVFTRDMAPQEVIPAMLSSCGGSLFYAQGKWVLRVGKYRTPLTAVFDEGDLRGPLSVDTKTSRRDLFNSVTGRVSSPDEDWIPTDYPMITSSTFETEDGGERNSLELPLPFTTNMPMAQRLAKQTLYKAREQIIVKAKFGLKAFEARVGDNIKVTNSRMGWNQKVFEVIEWKFSYGGGTALEVELTLKETSSGVYDWNAEESSFSSNNTTISRFNYAPQPTFDGTPTTEVIIQEDGTLVASAEVAWTVTDTAYVNDYVLEWKRSTETNYQSIVTTNLYYRIPSVQIGNDYNLRISSRNRLGIQSDLSTTTVTITGDTTAPAVATNVSGSGAFRSNFITWTNPSDSDFKQVQVYVNTSNTTSGASLIGTTASSEFTHTGLPELTTRYYWLKSQDYTGNVSGFSSGTGVVTTLQDPQDGTDGTGADGATGDTVVTGKVYYQTLQGSAPSTPSATSYNVSTASFTGLTSNWSLTQPSVDITDTSIQEWSSDFTVTIDGTTSAQTKVFTSPSGSIQVATDIESDNYVAGTSGWKIERDTGNAEFQNATIRGTLNATDITAGTLEADHIKLTGSQLENSGGTLLISSGGVDTDEIASEAVSIRGEYQATSFTGIISNSDKYLIARINSFTLSATAIVEFTVCTLVSRDGTGDLQLRYNTSAYGTPSYTTAVTPVGTAFAIYGTSIDIDADSASSARGLPNTVVLRQSLGAGTYHFGVYAGRTSGSVQYRGINATVKVVKR